MAFTPEGESREKIYIWTDYNHGISFFNPYEYWLHQYYAEKNLSQIISNANEEDYIYNKLERFLKSIPQAPYWEEKCHIENSNVLFILNEPELFFNIEQIYWDLLDKGKIKENLSIKDIAFTFYESMISWLGLIDHKNLGKINGERGYTCREVDQFVIKVKFKIFGKIAYFMMDNEIQHGKFNNIEKLKCIHINLFPFSQELLGWDDENPYNCQDEINLKINNIFNKPKSYNCKKLNSQNFECRLSCEVVKKNIDTIKTFCKNASNSNPKFIFIIGTSANIYEGKLYNNNEYEDGDNIIYHIVKYILTHKNSSNIEVRITNNKPLNGFGNYYKKDENGLKGMVFRAKSIDKKNSFIELEQIL